MPSMRVHFTDADLARTRLGLDIDPMWEVVNSAQALQHSERGLYLDPWRRRFRKRVAYDTALRSVLPLLFTLAPHAEYFPDFLTPPIDTADVDTGIETVLATPPRRLRAEITQMNTPTVPLRELADGTSAALRELRAAMWSYYRTAIEPHLAEIGNAVRADSAARAHTYLRGGAEAVLATFSPLATWRRPVLTFDYPVDRDLYLDGRGLRLIPSYFCVLHPVSFADPALPPILVYPVGSAARLIGVERSPGDHLVALLGATRATVLRSLVNATTTTGLAHRTGISPATASHHTTALREAGLITTERHGGFATHLVTPLGLQVIAAAE